MAYPTSLSNQNAGHIDGQTIYAGDDNTQSVDINALTVKVGSGASVPTTVGNVLTVTGAGATAWQASAGGGSGYATMQDEGTPLTARTALNFVGAGVSAADTAGVTTVTIPGGTGAATGAFNVKDYGATGNGSTNDTVAVQAAITAAGAAGGGSVLFPPGTYSISQVTIPPVEIQLQGNGSATLFHRGTAGTSMLINQSATVCAQFTMEDLTIDGNKGTYSASTGGGGTGTGTVYTGGQPESTVTVTLTFGAGATFRNCRFVNSRHHALDLLGSSSRILVENCTFSNMAEWGGTTGTDSTPLRFNGAATIYDAVVAFCSFEHPTPAQATYNPGGLIVDVQGANLPVRLNVDTCRFKNIGQAVSGTTVGNIYIYRAAGGSSVTNCLFETPYFTCVAVENSSDFIVQGNRAFTNASLNSHVFSMQGNERSNNVQEFRVQFVNNTISGTASNLSEAFYVDAGGTAGTYAATDVLISNNHIQNCRIGVRVSNTKGMIDIHDNLFRDLLESGYGRALWINGSLTPCVGVISFHHNYCENLIGNPIGCDDVANPGLAIRVEGNTFSNVANNDAGLQLRGCDEAVIVGNKWLGTPTGGSIITLGGTNSAGRVTIRDNMTATLSTITRTLATSVKVQRNSWQPIGDLGAVSVPATTVESAAQLYDCTVYILGGTITVISVGPPGGTQVTGLTSLAAGVSVRVNAGNVIKMTYSAAPTSWKWIAD